MTKEEARDRVLMETVELAGMRERGASGGGMERRPKLEAGSEAKGACRA